MHFSARRLREEANFKENAEIFPALPAVPRRAGGESRLLSTATGAFTDSDIRRRTVFLKPRRVKASSHTAAYRAGDAAFKMAAAQSGFARTAVNGFSKPNGTGLD